MYKLWNSTVRSLDLSCYFPSSLILNALIALNVCSFFRETDQDSYP